MPGGLFPGTKLDSWVWLLLLITQGIAGILGRGIKRTRSADAGGCGPACLHGLITAAMSCLSAIRNAIVVCLSGGRCHHEERKCEQRRGGGDELFRSRFHLFFFLFLQVGRNRPQKIPECGIALRFTTAHLIAELGLAWGYRYWMSVVM